VPDEESKKSTGLESNIPRWDKMEKISTEIETIFFDNSAKEQLSVYEMSVIINRLNLLFEEHKLVNFVHEYGKQQSEENKTISISGRDSIYR